MKRFLVASSLSLAFLTISGIAQDAKKYTINLSRDYKVGQKLEISITNQESSKMELKKNGTAQDPRNQAIEAKFDGIQEVLEVKDGKLAKAKITVKKLVATMGGKEETILKTGVVIDASYGSENVTFKVDGEEPTQKERAILSKFFQPNKKGTDDDELFGSKTPQAVGDKWEINSAAAAAGFSKNGMELDEKEISGWMKLVKIVEEDGVKCMDIRGEIELKTFAPALPPGMTIAKSGGNITMRGLFPVDGTSHPLDKAMTMTFSVNSKGDQNGTAIEVLMSGEMKRSTATKHAK